ncbi:MAG: 4Fe-4S dicluster domain-containing protein [bacterium]
MRNRFRNSPADRRRGANDGTPQAELTVPLLKTSGGILAFQDKEIIFKDELDCIRCGRCVRQCPQQLVPTRLMKFVRNKRYNEAEKLDINGCLDCGVCSYVCPSGIPLLHWLKVGKQKIAEGRKV